MGEQGKSAGELPDDVDELRGLATKQGAEIAALRETIDVLSEQLQGLRRELFGSKSEKGVSDFDVTKQDLLPFEAFLEERRKLEKLKAELEEKKKRKGKPEKGADPHGRRREFPAHLPREESSFRLSGEERQCCGQAMRNMGFDKSEVLERIELCYVHVHLREKCVCDRCSTIKVAEAEIDRVFDRALLGTNFVAQLIYDRFLSHVPYARLERKFRDEGLPLSRSLLCETVLRGADVLEPIYDSLREDVLSADLVQSDDTEITQRFGKKKGKKKVNFWVYRSDGRGAFFEITDSRSRDGPATVLADFSGLLQTDGHSCFKSLRGVTNVGCWAHARRKFFSAAESGDPLAEMAMAMITQIFAVEKTIRELELGDEPEDWGRRIAMRNELSKSTIDDLFAWADDQAANPPRPPKSNLMKAVGYLRNQRDALQAFLLDGRIVDITNNPSERALRGPVVGRKNWLFFGNEEGARRSAILLSLVQSCRELDVNPRIYIADVLRRIAAVTDAGELLPRRWQSKYGEEARARYEEHAKRFAPSAVAE